MKLRLVVHLFSILALISHTPLAHARKKSTKRRQEFGQLCQHTFSIKKCLPYHFLMSDEERQYFIDNHLFNDSEAIEKLDAIYKFLSKSPNPRWYERRKPEGPPGNILNHTLFCQVPSSSIHIVGFLKNLDGYILKMMRRKRGNISIGRSYDDFDSNIQRVVEAERFRQCIKENNFKHIFLPQKWLYHVPGQPHELNDSNYIVVVEMLLLPHREKNRQLLRNLELKTHREALDELFDLIAYVGFSDAGASNIRVFEDPESDTFVFAIIDTEVLTLQKKKDLVETGIDLKSRITDARNGLRRFARNLSGDAKNYWNARVKHWEKLTADLVKSNNAE